MKVINDDVLNEVVKAYDEYGNVKKVSQITGVSIGRIYSYLKIRQIEVKSKSDEKHERVEEMFRKGYTQTAIAKKLNIPIGTVNTIIFRLRQQESLDIKDASEVVINHVEDPVFYVEHKASNEVYSYQGKRYKDVSAIWLGG